MSSLEAARWAQTAIQQIEVTLDDTPLVLVLQSVAWPDSTSTLLSGEQSIRIHLQSSWRIEDDRQHTFVLHSQYNPKTSVCWFEVQGESGIVFTPPEQANGRLLVRFERTMASDNAASLSSWESGKPTMPRIIESLRLDNNQDSLDSPSQTQWGMTALLGDLIKEQQISPVFVATAIAIAVLIGALHALGPGHGKTIVAAYLVGSQGKFYHTSVNPQEIRIYNIETGQSQSTTIQTGSPAMWSPKDAVLLLIDTEQVGQAYHNRLFRYDLYTQTRTALNGEYAVDESYPAWSPDGTRIAVVRREWVANTPARGRQIWLLRADGSEAYPVTQIETSSVDNPSGRLMGGTCCTTSTVVARRASSPRFVSLISKPGRAKPSPPPDAARHGC